MIYMQKSMDKPNTTNNFYLTFRLGTDTYAAHVKQVEKIIAMPQIQPVSHGPQWLKGILKQNDSILPIIDARIKAGMQEISQSARTSILISKIQKDEEILWIGTIVDDVLAVAEFNRDESNPLPENAKPASSGWATGKINADNQEIILTDMQKMLRNNEITEILKIIASQENTPN